MLQESQLLSLYPDHSLQLEWHLYQVWESRKYPLDHDDTHEVPSSIGKFDGTLQELHVVVVPEHVLHVDDQLELSIGVAIVAPVEELDPVDATGTPPGEYTFTWNEPVVPVVDGFSNKPRSTPNCPELSVFGKRPLTVTIVFPLLSVPTVQVMLTVVSKRSLQLFSEVEPPVLVDEIFTSLGKVITTYEF